MELEDHSQSFRCQATCPYPASLPLGNILLLKGCSQRGLFLSVTTLVHTKARAGFFSVSHASMFVQQVFVLYVLCSDVGVGLYSDRQKVILWLEDGFGKVFEFLSGSRVQKLPW